MKLASDLYLLGLFIFVLLLSGCNTIKPNSEINIETQKEKNEDSTQVDIVVEDPMKSSLPLALIKAYDELTPFLENKQYSQVISKLQVMQTQFPKESGPSYRLSRIHFDQKDYQQALDSIASCLLIAPQNYYALNLQGVIYREQGEFESAKAAYLQSIKVFPSHPESHLNLAILADIYLYDLELALAHYQIYLRLTGLEDKKIEGWVIDLNRRIERKE